jgi:phytoene/squalene synthetase
VCPLYSFAIVIQQLPNPLRDAICVFYLVLRGLDTVEDDMALKDDFKLPQLRQFHTHIYKRCAAGDALAASGTRVGQAEALCCSVAVGAEGYVAGG